jgi:hypothetical protein
MHFSMATGAGWADGRPISLALDHSLHARASYFGGKEPTIETTKSRPVMRAVSRVLAAGV